jgi:hypothetical protein
MTDLQKAIDAIKAKLPACQTYIDYYEGRHKLAFASSKFETAFGRTVKDMRDNLCPIVVDSTADRMEILNFSGDDEKEVNAVADQAWEIWLRETLELVSNDIHRDAVKCGESFLIVWADESNQAKFYPQDSRHCVLIEDEDTARKLFGAKQWVNDEKLVRLNLYYDNRIEKYITRKKITGSFDLKESSFKPLEGVEGEEAVTQNPYGVLPMFKFEGTPVLSDAIPLQDMLNKTLADRMVTQEFGAFPQRWAVGLAPPTNEITGYKEAPFKAGVDRLWVSEDGATKFGEFSSASLEPYLKAANDDRLSMARATGTPLHFFGLTGNDVPSGEALKTLESRFTKRVKRLTLNFGTVWANVMRFALQIEGTTSAENLTTQWQTPEQRSEKEQLDAAVIKQTLGIPQETLWEELGYTEEDIAIFKKAQELADAKEEARLNAEMDRLAPDNTILAG